MYFARFANSRITIITYMYTIDQKPKTATEAGLLAESLHKQVEVESPPGAKLGTGEQDPTGPAGRAGYSKQCRYCWRIGHATVGP